MLLAFFKMQSLRHKYNSAPVCSLLYVYWWYLLNYLSSMRVFDAVNHRGCSFHLSCSLCYTSLGQMQAIPKKAMKEGALVLNSPSYFTGLQDQS